MSQSYRAFRRTGEQYLNDMSLIDACRENNKDEAMKLIQLGATVHAQSNYKQTPLHVAASNGSTECVELLLQHKAKVNVSDLGESCPLEDAARNGHTKCVALLLKYDACVHGFGAGVVGGEYPIYAAASNGHTGCVELLLQHKAAVNAPILGFYKTPLHAATSNGHTECATLLLKHKANVNAQDIYKKTPLHLAASNGDLILVVRMLKVIEEKPCNKIFHEEIEKEFTLCANKLIGDALDPVAFKEVLALLHESVSDKFTDPAFMDPTPIDADVVPETAQEAGEDAVSTVTPQSTEVSHTEIPTLGVDSLLEVGLADLEL